MSAAIRIIGEMERFGLDLVEQPVSGRNLAEMAYVRARIAPPMLANEASWTRYDQLEVIRHVPYVDGCLELRPHQGSASSWIGNASPGTPRSIELMPRPSASTTRGR